MSSEPDMQAALWAAKWMAERCTNLADNMPKENTRNGGLMHIRPRTCYEAAEAIKQLAIQLEVTDDKEA